MKTLGKPLLMVLFVLGMIYLMQEKIEEQKQLDAQKEMIDPSSVIYSDVGELETPLQDLFIEDSPSHQVIKE